MIGGRPGLLHLTSFLQGGAGRAITYLACAQREAGHAVTVVTSATGEPGYANYPEYLERLVAAGVTLHRSDSLFKRDQRLNRQVLALLQQRVAIEEVGVVHAHAGVPAMVGRQFVAAVRRIPVLQTQHGWGTSKTPAQAAADLETLHAVDRVVATSAATRDLLIGYGIAPNQIEVIPCGLPEQLAGQAPHEAEMAVAPLRRRGPVVGCIGSVNDNKNQRLLIEALVYLHDLGVSAVFVGEGAEALRESAETSGVANRVHAAGYQPEAARWLRLFDVLVLPSRSEGQGLVVLEAFREGIPAVASDIPALAQLVINESNGFLFPSGDAAALARAIRKTLSLTAGERTALIDRARHTFAADYTVARMVRRYEELYRTLVGGW